MVSKKVLEDENKAWHEDHVKWIDEVALWQHETQHLVALLYLLERALPEHASVLVKHVELIEQHEQLVNRYECGLDERCLPTCPDFKTEQEQAEFHQKLSKLHVETKQEHLELKQMYSEEMEKFRALVKKLLDESQP